MFQRLSIGWELAKQSINVLKLDKELLLFPALSGLSCLAVLASFAVPLFFSGTLQTIADNPDGAVENVLLYVGLFLFTSSTTSSSSSSIRLWSPAPSYG